MAKSRIGNRTFNMHPDVVMGKYCVHQEPRVIHGELYDGFLTKRAK